MRHRDDFTDRPWRKSRLAARILLRKEAGRMTARDRRIATQLSRDAEVTNRLIQQGLYYLRIGTRKHEFDQRLGLVHKNLRLPGLTSMNLQTVNFPFILAP